MPKVSLILPSFRRAHLLDLGLYSISLSTYPFSLEIIVVNDGIKDETEQICNKYRSRFDIKYYFSGQRNTSEIKKRGPSWAINIGVKKSTGDVVVISCPEVWHLNNCLEGVVRPFLENRNGVMTTPGTMYYDDKGRLLQVLQEDRSVRIIPGMIHSLVVGGERIEALRMPYLMGMFKRDFIAVGGYDERMIGYCGDDNDFADRVSLYGLQLEYTSAKIIHLYHSDTNPGGSRSNNPDWVYNYNLWQENKKNRVITVNQGKEWGVL